MDYIIYLKEEKDFLRFTDKQIFISADAEDVISEVMKSEATNSNPIILSIEYISFVNSAFQKMTAVKIKNGKGMCGYFTYSDGDDDAFFKELEDFAREYKG